MLFRRHVDCRKSVGDVNGFSSDGLCDSVASISKDTTYKQLCQHGLLSMRCSCLVVTFSSALWSIGTRMCE